MDVPDLRANTDRRLADINHVTSFGLLHSAGSHLGAAYDPNPYHVPPERLTDGRPSVCCFALARRALLREGATGTYGRGTGSTNSLAARAFSDGEASRQEWTLESKRLAACGMKFYQIAMRDNDPRAAMMFLKASERRATPCGANAPQGHSVQIMHLTATEQMKPSLRQYHARERELIDKRDLDGDQSPEVLTEINERAKRNRGPVGEA